VVKLEPLQEFKNKYDGYEEIESIDENGCPLTLIQPKAKPKVQIDEKTLPKDVTLKGNK
jgi:hypothetical protein